MMHAECRGVMFSFRVHIGKVQGPSLFAILTFYDSAILQLNIVLTYYKLSVQSCISAILYKRENVSEGKLIWLWAKSWERGRESDVWSPVTQRPRIQPGFWCLCFPTSPCLMPTELHSTPLAIILLPGLNLTQIPRPTPERTTNKTVLDPNPTPDFLG